ncbi:hypothetical protein D2T31_21830 [Sinirhodobacter populi]|uniref:Uncharacterized protein n=1 Tax=Paenirhodobacter populi TaxID=2306993 RepID=A0A443JYC2_9RHOB|nr:hypothetical protein [Sinirhodobacter populi]RWR25498.1 hypothetical protein D2T31_21830 [Sinirhodobacter populi]
MRKDNIDNRYRFVLGTEAAALAADHTPEGDLPRAEHLDAGIAALQREIELAKQVNSRLGQEFDRLDQRFQSLLSSHNDGMRGLMMTVGQTVRELHVIRRVLIISGATSSEQAERLYDKALPAINELRATMALWRQREGLEIPEFSIEEEERILNQLIQNPASERDRTGMQGESLGEALTEQFHRLREGFDANLTDERHQREMGRDDD